MRSQAVSAQSDEPNQQVNGCQEPALYTIEGAMEYSAHTRSRIYELIGRGVIEARKAGRRTLIVGTSLRRHVQNLPKANIRVGTNLTV